ncbi:MAG: hypothetical protein ORN51_09460 [Akkermansiaceae bacterium]|nr:hypothetical protein [Akkermansiaceae bacterium]
MKADPQVQAAYLGA